MPQERLTKNQRREQARELARAEREKAKRRERLFKWLIPSSITLALLAIATVVVLVIVNTQPAPQSEAGPENMISDGILFEGQDGGVAHVPTGAIPAEGEPEPTEHEDDGLAHIESYVDFSCPACKSFEEAYAQPIRDLVAAGAATLEVHPIAILQGQFAGSNYSERANNVGACVAEHAPESFLDVMDAMYAQQPSEGTTGHTNRELVSIVHQAGVTDEDLDQCIEDEFFLPFVQSASERATSNPDLVDPATGRFSTPTLVVNGERWDRSVDFLEFVQSHIALDEPETETDPETETE